MNITDEVRELAHVFSNVWMDENGDVTYTTGTSAPNLESVNLEEYIKDIADRIDAEHEREMAERDSERFNALMDARERGVNAVLKEPEGFGLTALPKDADGVPWHIGDRDENGNIVMAIKLATDGFWINVGCIYRPAGRARHYHAPTVEDVLREFAQECLTYATNVDDHEVVDAIAEYATKLQLAGDK